MVAGVGLEPHDLRVMSPTSYQLLHPAMLSWWMGLDSNQRSETRQIYSLLPLTTRESAHMELAIGLEPTTY